MAKWQSASLGRVKYNNALKSLTSFAWTGKSPPLSLIVRPTTMEHQDLICDECGGGYLAKSSQMAKLCPECAHRLYGYPACVHVFENGRCTKCHWSGQSSAYLGSDAAGG